MIGTVRHSLFAAIVLVPSAVFALVKLDQFASARPATAQATDAAPLARFCGEHCSPAWMDANLRINEVQVVGTAESYKLRPDKALLAVIRMAGSKKDAEAIDFGQPSLDKQLDKDARSLDFDVAYDPQGGAYKNPAGANLAMDLLPDEYTRAMAKPGFKVIHVLDVDYRSSC